MDLKSIKWKPELIVLATLMVCALAGPAMAAITPDTISLDAGGDWIYEKVVSLMWLSVKIMSVVAVLAIIWGSPSQRAYGKYIIAGIFAGVVLFYVFPGFLQSFQEVAVSGPAANATAAP
ncbi:MAG: hypothetical protein DRI69_09795 [Bacteroidetes bacterium]|nr:MAG: hypothetical protein DRI69_09795 [Bacteroidota bacterium]